jgi:hypothetical protein
MLSCIIVHYPYPHPPRSAHTGDTLIPGSQSFKDFAHCLINVTIILTSTIDFQTTLITSDGH